MYYGRIYRNPFGGKNISHNESKCSKVIQNYKENLNQYTVDYDQSPPNVSKLSYEQYDEHKLSNEN